MNDNKISPEHKAQCEEFLKHFEIEKWWLAEGAIVDVHFMDGDVTTIRLTNECLKKFRGTIKKIIPVGVPFDCTPEWAEFVTFDNDSYYYFHKDSPPYCETEGLPYRNIPEEWEAKTLPVTDELKKLIGIRRMGRRT